MIEDRNRDLIETTESEQELSTAILSSIPPIIQPLSSDTPGMKFDTNAIRRSTCNTTKINYKNMNNGTVCWIAPEENSRIEKSSLLGNPKYFGWSSEETRNSDAEGRLAQFGIEQLDSVELPVLSLDGPDQSSGGRRSVAMSLLDKSDVREDPHPSARMDRTE